MSAADKLEKDRTKPACKGFFAMYRQFVSACGMLLGACHICMVYACIYIHIHTHARAAWLSSIVPGTRISSRFRSCFPEKHNSGLCACMRMLTHTCTVTRCTLKQNNRSFHHSATMHAHARAQHSSFCTSNAHMMHTIWTDVQDSVLDLTKQP